MEAKTYVSMASYNDSINGVLLTMSIVIFTAYSRKQGLADALP